MRREGDDILQVRAPALCFYVLRAEDGLYLIDGGFVGGRWFLERALRRRGWEKERVRGILVTHGHLDHVLNVHGLAEATGAWVAAPRLDREHFEGRHPYHGAAQVTGVLEAVGRPLLGYKSFQVDRWLEDGDELEVWDGLRAVHLPGHTVGHMGFYCAKRKLLFSADLFGSNGFGCYPPPDIFNDAPAEIPGSFAKAAALDLAGIWPNHGDRARAEVHLERFRRRLKLG